MKKALKDCIELAITERVAEIRELPPELYFRIINSYQVNGRYLDELEAKPDVFRRCERSYTAVCRDAVEIYILYEAFRRVAVERGLISESEAKS